MHSRYWSDHTSESIAEWAAQGLIAVLPLAATEQHGPHLPIGTDTAIVDGVVRATLPKLPPDLPALFLPTCPYGKSNEHARYPGTITLSATTLIAMWMEIGASVARAGVKKLVLFNGHGGQVSAMDIVTQDLREKHGLLVVAANWYGLGLPEGMFDAHELKHGIHGGDRETSVMMALAPPDVRADRRQAFASLTEVLERECRHLSIDPGGAIGWQTQDLNPLGACGDASRATAEKGRGVLDLVSSRFVELLQEVQRYDLSRLDNRPPWG